MTERLDGQSAETSGTVALAVYADLRRLAQSYMRRERPEHTLQPTALVHEAYLRLAEVDRMHFHDRSHFVAIAATMMRRILVDHARARARVKRGAGITITSAGDAPVDPAVDPPPLLDLIALDDALAKLARVDPRQASVVELRFFGGLTVEEAADALNLSPKTIKREWAIAKAWLHQELTA